jgi:hypothetical protein
MRLRDPIGYGIKVRKVSTSKHAFQIVGLILIHLM